jgi:hypothetical protein
VEGGLYEYSINKYIKDGKVLAHFWLKLMVLPGSLTDFYGIFRDPLHNLFSNIKVDIGHPAVGLRCRNPPMYLSQLKAQAIPLIETSRLRTVKFLTTWNLGQRYCSGLLQT